MRQLLARLVVAAPPTLVFALAASGELAQPRELGILALATLVAAGVMAAWLPRAARSTVWLGLCAGSVVLVIAAPLVSHALSTGPRAVSIDPVRILRLASMAASGALALTLAAALIAGLALGTATAAARTSHVEPFRVLFACVTLVLTPTVILWSSEGWGFAYSLLRWSPLGFAILAVLLSTATPPGGRAAASVVALYPAAAALALAGAWAFVEVPMIRAAASGSICRPSLVSGTLELEASTFAWRLLLLLPAALLPVSLTLLDGGGRRAGRALGAVGLALTVALAGRLAVEATGSRVAAQTPHDPLAGVPAASAPDLSRRLRSIHGSVSVRVDGRSDAPLEPVIRFAEEHDAIPAFMSRGGGPHVDEARRRVARHAPLLAPLFEAACVHGIAAQIVDECARGDEVCMPIERARESHARELLRDSPYSLWALARIPSTAHLPSGREMSTDR